MEELRDRGSFRDPSGFVFRRHGTLYRQVNERYRAEYDLLMASGLYDDLTGAGLLVPHDEISLTEAAAPGAYRVLRPEPVPFVSYPYEWCFRQLQVAALLTLQVQVRAMERGLTLKDASAFNVQFRGHDPVFIDTLSFEAYQEGRPWLAYGQFCRHFVAPLQLMSRVDMRLGRMSASFLDGIPLDLASALLPKRSWLSPRALIHTHLHARSVRRFQDTDTTLEKAGQRGSVSRRGLEGILESLRATVGGLRWSPEGTEWADYEESHGYDPASLDSKQELVGRFLDRVRPGVVWDLGANTGAFSRIARERSDLVVALDADPGAVETLYRRLRGNDDRRIHPLWVDLTNPTPGLGWMGAERQSLAERGPADVALALALVHHLAISGNVPFELMAEGFATLARALVIEFVPKDDPQAQRLLRSREDIFDRYTQAQFENTFSAWFDLDHRETLSDSGRILYLMRGRD